MILEAIVAFILVLISTLVIFFIGKSSAPKTVIGENEQASYACGEKVHFHGLKINVSLYKYLIFFVIFDTSILVLAFASLSIISINPLIMILYIGVILAAGLVLFQGGED